MENRVRIVDDKNRDIAGNGGGAGPVGLPRVKETVGLKPLETPCDAVNDGSAGARGNALMFMTYFGYGQSWQTVIRSSGTTYYNTTGKPIFIMAQCTAGATEDLTMYINGISSGQVHVSLSGNAVGAPIYGIIQDGSSYVINGNISTVSELR